MPRPLTVAAVQLGPVARDGDGVIIHQCDLDRCRGIQDNIYNFGLHREPESYRLITATKDVVEGQ